MTLTSPGGVEPRLHPLGPPCNSGIGRGPSEGEGKLCSIRRGANPRAALLEQANIKSEAEYRNFVKGLLRGDVIPKPGPEATLARKVMAQVRGQLVLRAQKISKDSRHLDGVEAELEELEQDFDKLQNSSA